MGRMCALLAPNQVELTEMKAYLEPEFSVVAMSDNVLSFSDAMDSLTPDVAVIDTSVRAPYQGNFVRQIKSRHPDVRIIVLDDDRDPVAVRKSMSWGASGYVLKQSVATELPEAVREVSQGRCYVSPGVPDWEDPGDGTNGTGPHSGGA